MVKKKMLRRENKEQNGTNNSVTGNSLHSHGTVPPRTKNCGELNRSLVPCYDPITKATGMQESF